MIYRNSCENRFAVDVINCRSKTRAVSVQQAICAFASVNVFLLTDLVPSRPDPRSSSTTNSCMRMLYNLVFLIAMTELKAYPKTFSSTFHFHFQRTRRVESNVRSVQGLFEIIPHHYASSRGTGSPT